MSDVLSTDHIDCRLRTGSVGLLRKTGKIPTSSPQQVSKLAATLKLTGRIKTLGSRNHRHNQKISNNDTSNPHSSVETTWRQRLRPRGFLP
jgi:hypothetical protein